MTKRTHALLFLLLTCATAALPAAQPPAQPAPAERSVPDAVEPALLPAYTRLDAQLAAAGAPSAEGLAALARLGFSTVIDLRAASEPGVAEEAEAVRKAGLRYVHVPVTAATFSQADVDAVRDVLASPQSGRVLLHCASSNRVGALWGVLQAQSRGLNAADAEQVARGAGLQSPAMLAAMKRLLR
jgi:uncharacterized protein (TIGR01244 family)